LQGSPEPAKLALFSDATPVSSPKTAKLALFGAALT
jgi:hypothetical protein